MITCYHNTDVVSSPDIQTAAQSHARVPGRHSIDKMTSRIQVLADALDTLQRLLLLPTEVGVYYRFKFTPQPNNT